MHLDCKLVLATALLLGAGSALPAATITYVTPPGSTTTGGAVSAQAVFTTSTDTVGLTLTNVLANPKNVAQLISDVFFTVGNGGAALTAGSVTSGTGTTVSVDKNGKATFGPSVAAGYILTNDGTQFHLDALAAGGAGPKHLIIGPADSLGVYSNAKGSIANNSGHNPFLYESATFVFSVPGATAESSISNVVFSFGTTAGINVDGVRTRGTPEPASISLMGTAVGLLGYVRFRRRRAAA